MMKLPRIFIGSSVESRDIAGAFSDQIDREFEPIMWTDGVFSPGSYSLPALISTAKSVEYAVIVLGKDDSIMSRGEAKSSPRDNVIFELGLFIGILSPEKVFFLLPRERKDLKLPSDLLGITPLEYIDNRTDGNLKAATGGAARALIQVKKSHANDEASIDLVQVYKDARDGKTEDAAIESVAVRADQQKKSTEA